jgi:hypothetical protein
MQVEEFQNLYSTPSTIRQIKSSRIMQAGHVRRKGEERKCTRFGGKNPKERDHLKDSGVDGRMGSEWILGRLARGVWSGFTLFRIGTAGGLL